MQIINIIEICAAIAIIASVYLLSNEKEAGWILSVLGSALYGYCFYSEHLYGGAILQSVFLVQSIIGLNKWWKSFETFNDFRCINIHRLDLVFQILIMFFSFWILGLLTILGVIDNFVTMIDYLLLLFSLSANFLLINRIIQSWYFWMFINLCYIVIFCILGIWILSVLNLILIFLSIKGLRQWKKKLILP